MGLFDFLFFSSVMNKVVTERAVHQATVLTIDLRLTMQGMKKVMMIAVMTTAFTMTVIVMIHTIVVTTTTIVKMIATDSTLRNSILTIVITKV